MKIVLFDTNTMGMDLDFSPFERFGNVEKYAFSTPSECIERGKEATVCISNKIQYTPQLLDELKGLKLICLTSTGTNTVDLDYARQKGITVCNIVGYSTLSVTQLTFSLLFYLMAPLNFYDHYVKKGDYVNDFKFTHYQQTWNDLSGKTYGIVGLGNIGLQVAKAAEAFGANVIYYSTSGRNSNDQYTRVSFDELLSTSDIISIHAPLNDQTNQLFDLVAFSKMKSSAILLNLGRGAILVEEDLVTALNRGMISKAGIDVLAVEPMIADHPFKKIEDQSKLFVTPHIGWASIESRKRMVDEVVLNIEAFLEGKNRNCVNL